MAEENITVPELLELLEVSLRCAEAAAQAMRFDFHDTQQRVAVGLHQAVLEYGRAVALLVRNGFLYAPAAPTRCALDALVDIVNTCADRQYCDHLELADAKSWKKVLEQASQAKNAYFAGLTATEAFPEGRRMFAARVKDLEAKGVKKLEIEERFNRAGMGAEYDSVYSLLSAEAHGNVSFIRSRYFDVRADIPGLREGGTRVPGQHGYDKTCTLHMAEIVLAATERVLRLCGHGTAVLAAGDQALERIRARFQR